LLLLIALVLECGAAVFTSPALHVRKVRVNGIEGLTPTEALVSLSQARVSPHSHIVLYPTERLAHSLQSLPWVAKASVRRHLPDTLEVQLIPRIPIALLVTREGKWELDANGIPIRMARSQSLSSKITLAAPAKIVFGRPVEVPGVAGAIAIAANNVGLKPLPITEIRVDQNAELCLNMRDGIQIQLGTADNLEDKLALIRRIYEGMPGIEEQMQMIDVRCPEAPACIPRTAEAAAPRSAKQDAAGDTRVNAYGASGSLTR
jgi:cell division protein FtsQ